MRANSSLQDGKALSQGLSNFYLSNLKTRVEAITAGLITLVKGTQLP